MAELVIVSASDEAALQQEMSRLVAFIDRVPEVSLVDIGYTCSLRKGPCAIALVVKDVADLRARLDSARSRLESDKLRRIRDKSGTYYFRDRLLGDGRGRLAFVYPGVMSFYPDMMRDLVIENDVCRHAFDELEEALKENEDFTPSSFIFPPAAYYRRDADIYSSGAYAQALVSTYAGLPLGTGPGLPLPSHRHDNRLPRQRRLSYQMRRSRVNGEPWLLRMRAASGRGASSRRWSRTGATSRPASSTSSTTRSAETSGCHGGRSASLKPLVSRDTTK